MARPVCQYYLRGNCRFGDRCWNEHTDDHRGANVRGDYYVSNDNRSLWRRDGQWANTRPSGHNTSNKFAALGHDGPNRKSFYEDTYEPEGVGQLFFIQGPGSFGKQFGNASNAAPSHTSKFGLSHTNAPQQRNSVDFSFNAASQAIQNSGRHAPPTFSFTGALNKQLANENYPQTKSFQAQPVNFSFKSAQSQLSGKRVVGSPQNADFGRAPNFPGFNRQPSVEQQSAGVGVRPGQVSFSFKNAQNQLNERTVVSPQQKPLYGRTVQESLQTTAPGPDRDVPSMLSESDILKTLNLYSSMSQLSDWEKEQFQIARFTAGKIPTVPPPQELC